MERSRTSKPVAVTIASVALVLASPEASAQDGPAAAPGGGGAAAQRSPAEPAADEGPRHDVRIEDAPIADALRLVSEVFDASLAVGTLPDRRVSLRLDAATAADAFGALAQAGDLRIERRDGIVRASAAADAPAARRVVAGPFAKDPEAALAPLGEGGLRVDRPADDLVLVEGPESTVAAAASLLESLRAPRSAPVSPSTEVFRLGLADGERALQSVESLLDARAGERAVYDDTEHVLVVTASEAHLEAVARLLEELESDRPQLEIEARVVEVDRSTLQRVGAEWSLRVGLQGGAIPSTFPLQGVDDSASFVASPNDVGDDGPPFVLSQLDAQDLSVVLELLARDDETRVLASPRVTALHNRPATIQIGRTIRVPTFVTDDALDRTAVNEIETIEVGTSLEVLPRVSGERVFLRVDSGVSEVESFSPDGLPVVSERGTTTEVVLRSGETLCIGGLIRESEGEQVQKVPFLGDVPILGRLFRHRTTEKQTTEVLVFLTPRRLPSPEERAHLRPVDGVWLPRGAAEAIARARADLESPDPSQRVHGLRALEELDAAALPRGVDLAEDARRLSSADPDPSARTAAVELLLRRRPAEAWEHLRSLEGGRDLAAAALGAPLAPHLRDALGAALGRTEGGVAALRAALREAAAAEDAPRIARLLRALSAADRPTGARFALYLLTRPERGVVAAAIDALIAHPLPAARGRLLGLAGTSDPETAARAVTALALGAGGPDGREDASRLAAASDGLLPRRELDRLLRHDGKAAEPATAWASPARSPRLVGPEAERERVRAALELLADRAPDHEHLVRAAADRIAAGSGRDRVLPGRREVRVASRGAEPRRLAHRLVHLAVRVFEARTRGLPAEGARALAAGVRAEVRALERLTGVSCSPARIDETVRGVLETRKEEVE